MNKKTFACFSKRLLIKSINTVGTISVSRFVMFSFFFLIVTISSSFSQTPVKWNVGEELTYKVTWSFIRLGTLKMCVLDTLPMNNQRVYHIQLHIDSNPLLFFVNYHSTFETYFTDNLKVQLCQYNEKEDGVTYLAKYFFDYEKNYVYVQLTDTTDTTNTIHREFPFEGRLLDGTSLVYYARANAHQKKIDTVSYVADEKYDQVIIHFKGQGNPIKMNDRLIPTYYLAGRVLNEGVAGLSGYFKGWFSADSQRVPLKAKLKVFIGFVNLELEKGWTR